MGIRDRMIEFASRDPDIDVEDFRSFVFGRFEEEDESPRQFQMSGDSQVGFSVGDASDLRANPSKIPSPTELINARNQLKNTEESGYTGNKKEAFNADTIPLFTYRRMAVDSIIGLGTDLIIGLVSSLPFEIVCDDFKVESVIRHIYRRHHNSIVRHCIRAGYRNGFVFGQKFWQSRNINVTANVGGKTESVFSGRVIDLKRIKFIDPEASIRYWRNTDEDIAFVQQYQSKGSIRINRNRLFWFALDEEFNNPFGSSRYKRAYPYWHYDKVIFQFSLRHLEKVGSPHLEGRYPLGTSKLPDGRRLTNDKIMKMMVKTIKSTGGIAMPSEMHEDGRTPQWSIEYKHPANASVDPYTEYLTFLDRRKLQALGIPDAVLITGGNYSEVDAKMDLLLILINDVINQIEEAINKDIIDYLAEYNFGPEWLDRVYLKINRGGLGRLKMVKDVLVQTFRAATSQQGYKVNQWPDFGAAFGELGISTVTHDETFSEDASQNVENQNKTKQDDEQRKEDSNGVSRLTPDERKRERKAKEGVVSN